MTTGPTIRRLAELRAPEVDERITADSILIQPVGAVEQHGPHLPFITDLLIAEAAASQVVERHGDELDLWMLEPLGYSKSNEHAWSAGSIWLGPETLLSVLDDLGRSLSTLPSRKLVFLNGHGGNSSLLNVACRELRLHHDLLTFLMHPSVPTDQGGISNAEELGMGVHAGLNETSVVLHLRPDLVDMDLAVRNVPAGLAENESVRFGGTTSFGWLSNDFGPDGHIGDPTGATAALGETLFEAAIARLAEGLTEVRAFEFPMHGGA